MPGFPCPTIPVPIVASSGGSDCICTLSCNGQPKTDRSKMDECIILCAGNKEQCSGRSIEKLVVYGMPYTVYRVPYTVYCGS